MVALSLAAFAPRESSAQTVIQVPHDIGVEHAEAYPYNFTGRVLGLTDTFTEIGSATLIRRHTALTAGHIVFDPIAGFLANASFTRGLYENAAFDQQQVSAVGALSGYQTQVTTFGSNSLEAFARDMGYLLLDSAPIDENWGTYTTNTALLSAATTQFFVVGYPGVTFDGRTMAYIVPMTPYTELGTTQTGTGTTTDSGDTGSFSNIDYQAEEGMSGGPVYVVPAGTNEQIIAGETVGGFDDASGEFNFSIIRAINAEANVFLTGAEYTSGLIKKVKIVAPKTVSKGSTGTFTTNIKFATPTRAGAAATTDRYPELKLKSNNAGTATSSKVINITKVSNTQFQVTFSPTIKSGTTATFSVYYGKNLPVINQTVPKPGKPVSDGSLTGTIE